MGFPLITHSHLQAVEQGLSFPICKLRFLHTYLMGGGNPIQSTRNCLLVCWKCLLPGAFVGGSLAVQVNLPTCLPRGCRGPVEGSSPRMEPSRPVGSRWGQSPPRELVLSAYWLPSLPHSWSLVNESCSFQGHRQACPRWCLGEKERVPEQRGEDQEWVQLASPGHM